MPPIENIAFAVALIPFGALMLFGVAADASDRLRRRDWAGLGLMWLMACISATALVVGVSLLIGVARFA